MNFIEMWQQMGPMAKAVGVVLIIMSMISFGVAIERIYTFTQARKQSKLYAPQVAKHLKEGRLKDAIAISGSKNFRYSHLAKVVLAGLQEYQFQQEAGGNLSREDLVDTVRRAIQRASALTANDLKKGDCRARDHRRDRAVRRTARHGRRHHHRVPGHRGHRARAVWAPSRPVSPRRSSKPRSGSSVAIPAVWFYNYLTGRIEYFNVEMDNSSSELVDYFIKKTA